MEVCRCTYCSNFLDVVTYWQRQGHDKSQVVEPVANVTTRTMEGVSQMRKRPQRGLWNRCCKKRKHDKDFWFKRFLIGIWALLGLIVLYNKLFGDHSSKDVETLLAKYNSVPIPGVPTAVEHAIHHASRTTGWNENLSLGAWYNSHVGRTNEKYRYLYDKHNISVAEL